VALFAARDKTFSGRRLHQVKRGGSAVEKHDDTRSHHGDGHQHYGAGTNKFGHGFSPLPCL
jgi:hypothetical protein